MTTPPWPLSAIVALDELESVFDRVRDTVRQTHWTGWVTLLVGIAGGLIAGRVAKAILCRLGDRVETRGWRGRALLVHAAAAPLSLALITLGLGIGLAPVAMSPLVRDFATRLIALLYIFSAGWFLYNAIGLIDVLLRRWTAGKQSRLDQGITPLVRKTLRIFLVVVFVLFTAENVLGANIGAWLAGLGIAGLAVSLAAQDSIRNLFGSLMIFLDRPFTVGEQIQFDKWEGPVEEIGFRSTKLRTLGGELVTIPNSRLADNPIVNVDKRPHIRRMIALTLAKDTAPDQVERALASLREILSDPDLSAAFDLERHPPRVVFDELTPSGNPVVKVHYWFTPPDDWACADHAQKLNLRLLRALTAADIKLA